MAAWFVLWMGCLPFSGGLVDLCLFDTRVIFIVCAVLYKGLVDREFVCDKDIQAKYVEHERWCLGNASVTKFCCGPAGGATMVHAQ